MQNFADACATLPDYKMRPSSLLTHDIINTLQCLKIAKNVAFLKSNLEFFKYDKIVLARCLKITEKVSLNNASEVSYVYI